MAEDRTGRRTAETPELRRLRQRIDALDRRIVVLLNERASLAREAGRHAAVRGLDYHRETGNPAATQESIHQEVVRARSNQLHC